MKLSLPLALLTSLAAAPAAAVVLDFESPASFESVLAYYDGGADGGGNIGPRFGVTFGGDALALRNDELGPYFSNAPSPIGVMAPVGAASTLNVAAGFTGVFGFFYSASQATLNGVQLWSGLNGTGQLIASFNLLANAQTGCSGSPYCRFDPVTTSFSGIAYSATFGNAANIAAIDNINVSPIPEPETVLLMSLGLAGLAAAARRRRR